MMVTKGLGRQAQDELAKSRSRRSSAMFGCRCRSGHRLPALVALGDGERAAGVLAVDEEPNAAAPDVRLGWAFVRTHDQCRRRRGSRRHCPGSRRHRRGTRGLPGTCRHGRTRQRTSEPVRFGEPWDSSRLRVHGRNRPLVLDSGSWPRAWLARELSAPEGTISDTSAFIRTT